MIIHPKKKKKKVQGLQRIKSGLINIRVSQDQIFRLILYKFASFLQNINTSMDALNQIVYWRQFYLLMRALHNAYPCYDQ